MTHGEKCQSLSSNIDKAFVPWFTFLLINWSWVRVPPHPVFKFNNGKAFRSCHFVLVTKNIVIVNKNFYIIVKKIF